MPKRDSEARLRILEDTEEIKKLKAKYCYLVDVALSDPSKWDELLEYFSDQAKIDFGPFGGREGKEAVSKFFRRSVAGSLLFSAHMAHNPIIEVEGDKAKGRWYFHVPATDKRVNRAVWITEAYEEEYMKEEGKWKFSFIKAEFFHHTPFDEGWVNTRMLG